ncbi:hypothetical protein Tco_0979270 [Tanacetum coccineum]
MCHDVLKPVTTASAAGKKGVGYSSGRRDWLKDAEDEQCRAMEDAAALREKLASLQQQAINGHPLVKDELE